MEKLPFCTFYLYTISSKMTVRGAQLYFIILWPCYVESYNFSHTSPVQFRLRKSILVVLQLCTLPPHRHLVALESWRVIPGNKGVNNFVFLRPDLIFFVWGLFELNEKSYTAEMKPCLCSSLIAAEVGRKINFAQNWFCLQMLEVKLMC